VEPLQDKSVQTTLFAQHVKNILFYSVVLTKRCTANIEAFSFLPLSLSLSVSGSLMTHFAVAPGVCETRTCVCVCVCVWWSGIQGPHSEPAAKSHTPASSVWVLHHRLLCLFSIFKVCFILQWHQTARRNL